MRNWDDILAILQSWTPKEAEDTLPDVILSNGLERKPWAESVGRVTQYSFTAQITSNVLSRFYLFENSTRQSEYNLINLFISYKYVLKNFFNHGFVKPL